MNPASSPRIAIAGERSFERRVEIEVVDEERGERLDVGGLEIEMVELHEILESGRESALDRGSHSHEGQGLQNGVVGAHREPTCRFSIESSLAEAAREDQPDQRERGHAGTRSPRVVTTGMMPAQ